MQIPEIIARIREDRAIHPSWVTVLAPELIALCDAAEAGEHMLDVARSSGFESIGDAVAKAVRRGDALKEAAATFDRYAEMHYAKATREGDTKGHANSQRAQLCRDAL